MLLCALASAAAADESIGAPRDGAALGGVDVASAARLIASGVHVNIIVAGGGARVKAQLGAGDARTQLQKLADAAGMGLAKRGAFWVIAPKATIDVLPARLVLSGGKRIDLDFVQVEVGALFKLLGDVGRKHVHSEVTGAVTVRCQNVRAWEVMALVAAIAGAKMQTEAGDVKVDAGALPVPSEAPPFPCARPEYSGNRMPPRLSCVASDRIELAAVYMRGVNGLALVRGQDSKSLEPRAELVRVGDRIGDQDVLVRSMTADSIELENGKVLRLKFSAE